jgi:hypothetical protein
VQCGLSNASPYTAFAKSRVQINADNRLLRVIGIEFRGFSVQRVDPFFTVLLFTILVIITVDWQIATDVLKARATFMFRAKQSKSTHLKPFDSEDESTTILRNVGI